MHSLLGVHAEALATFYNTAISSLSIFCSVCWGGNIKTIDRGWLEKIVKKKKKKKKRSR